MWRSSQIGFYSVVSWPFLGERPCSSLWTLLGESESIDSCPPALSSSPDISFHRGLAGSLFRCTCTSFNVQNSLPPYSISTGTEETRDLPLQLKATIPLSCPEQSCVRVNPSPNIIRPSSDTYLGALLSSLNVCQVSTFKKLNCHIKMPWWWWVIRHCNGKLTVFLFRAFILTRLFFFFRNCS